MAPAQSRRYDKIAVEIREEFDKLICEIYAGNENNRHWLFSSLASRSPHQSDLFERCCKMVLAIEWAERFTSEKGRIYVGDYAVFVCLQHELKRNKQINIEYTGHILRRISVYIRPWLCWIRNFIHLIQSLIFRCPHKESNWRGRSSLFLLDIFVFPGDQGGGRISSGVYHDRYYQGLKAGAPEEIQKQMVYLPTFNGSNWLYAFFQKARSVESMILKDDFLSLSDYISLATVTLKKINIPNKNLMINGIKINYLVNEELRVRRADLSKMMAEMNYLFVKRLKEMDIGISSVLNWHENQPIDRGFILGMRHFYPEVKIIGYQGFVVSPTANFYLYPTDYEISCRIAPDSIAVTGPVLVRQAMGYTNVPVFEAPAFRFKYLWNQRQAKPEPRNYTILIGLPNSIKEAYEIVHLINDLAKIIKLDVIKFLVKPHPSHNIEHIKNSINRKVYKKVKCVNENMSELMERSDLYIGASTSACVEALTKNLHVIILGSSRGLTSNPIPEELAREQWQVCYGLQELKEAIEVQISGSKKHNAASGENVRAQCFTEVTKTNTQNFVRILANQNK